MTYLVANWKCNKNNQEARQWLDSVGPKLPKKENLEVILCPSFIVLAPLRDEIQKQGYLIKLGAQNVAAFSEGTYTGEVSAKMLAGLVDYVLIGHSERAKYCGEAREDVLNKIKLALEQNLTPIILTQENQLDELVKFINQKIIVCYEPPTAISSGAQDTGDKAERPEAANEVCARFKAKLGNVPVLYGASVKPQNIAGFLSQPNIDGVIIGGASLSPESFLEIVNAAA